MIHTGSLFKQIEETNQLASWLTKLSKGEVAAVIV